MIIHSAGTWQLFIDTKCFRLHIVACAGLLPSRGTVCLHQQHVHVRNVSCYDVIDITGHRKFSAPSPPVRESLWDVTASNPGSCSSISLTSVPKAHPFPPPRCSTRLSKDKTCNLCSLNWYFKLIRLYEGRLHYNRRETTIKLLKPKTTSNLWETATFLLIWNAK